MKITEFITDKVIYENDGQTIYFKSKKKSAQIILTLRGWGSLQYMFKGDDGKIDLQAAAKFQDKIGKFIAEAINDKLEYLVYCEDPNAKPT
jgi:hypothetical protein